MKMGIQIWFFTISTFEMSGKYGFIRTFSGSGVLFRVASGKTVAKIINKIDLDIAIPGRDKKADYALDRSPRSRCSIGNAGTIRTQ